MHADAVLAAFYATVDNNATISPLLGGTGAGAQDTRIYRMSGPKNPTFPYAVFSPVTGTDERDLSNRHEIHLVQVDIFNDDRNANDVIEIIDAFTNQMMGTGILDAQLAVGLSNPGVWQTSYGVFDEEEYTRGIVDFRIFISGSV